MVETTIEATTVSNTAVNWLWVKAPLDRAALPSTKENSPTRLSLPIATVKKLSNLRYQLGAIELGLYFYNKQ